MRLDLLYGKYTMLRQFYLILCLGLIGCPSTGADTDPFATFTRAWRDNTIWSDGKAELALYDASRIIYGKPHRYIARLFTNKELSDKKSKSATERGRQVFKHHLREDIPTENYTYHFSTMVYVGAEELKSLNIDMGSQEDCGATFKKIINHAGTLTWNQFSYFPGEGHTSGAYRPTKNFAFQDALSLILRGYPFDQPRRIDLNVLADQTHTKLSQSAMLGATVEYIGRQTIDLPVGSVDSHHLRVTVSNKNQTQTHDYWFAADATAPWLHVMVQYEDSTGLRYQLRRQRRWAYWKR